MSQINVDSIANTNDDGPVYFPRGMRGDATNLQYEPKILTFDPVPLSTGISTTTNITITFDQQIQFSGVGTIYIREGSPTGSITTSFTCGVSTEATIAGETLVINPLEPVGINTTNYVILPSVGIANTFGAYYKGTESYFFKTLKPEDLFSVSGGTHEFTIASAPSPTGYYKYHVFTSTDTLTTTGSTVDADSLSGFMIAGGGGSGGSAPSPTVPGGGGGAGGLVSFTGPTLALGTGTYTITIGAGGAKGTFPSVLSGTGGDSTISTPTATLLTAYGGGAGGVHFGTRGPTSPIPGDPGNVGEPGGSGGGAAAPTYTSGTGVPGQGYPGGPGSGNPSTFSHSGGGAGGAGAAYSPTLNGSKGGNGSPQPNFSSPLISPRVPTIPANSFSAIGPSGLYGGGGGGGNGGPAPNGGPGGGGESWANPNGNHEGYTNTGGGAGSGYGASGSIAGYAGGSGVFMLRYAVPAP
jgi:hypothetical protein